MKLWKEKKKIMNFLSKLYFVLFLMVSFSNKVWSSSAESNKVGNGGNVVYCANEKAGEYHAQLLDFYEENFENSGDGVESSKNNFKSTEQKSTANFEMLTPEKIAELKFLKLKDINPRISEQYLRRLHEIQNELEFKKNVTLTVIPDSFHYYKPISKNCSILQIAIKKNLKSKAEKRFIIREDLWKQLSSTDKAGLLMHEIIYEHFAKLGEENSIKARKFNRFLFAASVNKKDFWALIKDLQLPIYPVLPE